MPASGPVGSRKARRDEEVAELDDELANLGGFSDHGFRSHGPDDRHDDDGDAAA